jgi:hypothetical protein
MLCSRGEKTKCGEEKMITVFDIVAAVVRNKVYYVVKNKYHPFGYGCHIKLINL